MNVNSQVIDMMEVTGPRDRHIAFTIQGNPVAQQRPRLRRIMGRVGNLPVIRRVIMYDPHSAAKRNLASAVRAEMLALNIAPHDGSQVPISLIVDFVLPRPRGDYVVSPDGVARLNATHNLYPRVKDVDNMLKFLMDALANVAYNNDGAIASINARKRFDGDLLCQGYTKVHLVCPTIPVAELRAGEFA